MEGGNQGGWLHLLPSPAAQQCQVSRTVQTQQLCPNPLLVLQYRVVPITNLRCRPSQSLLALDQSFCEPHPQLDRYAHEELPQTLKLESKEGLKVFLEAKDIHLSSIHYSCRETGSFFFQCQYLQLTRRQYTATHCLVKQECCLHFLNHKISAASMPISLPAHEVHS